MYPITNALRSQFNWVQYRLLIRIDDDYKREYYELETLNNAWTGRELERQINSLLYERLLVSNSIILTALKNCRTKIRRSAYYYAQIKMTQ